MTEPENSPWVDMARELANNPDSPKSLAIMSSVNAALNPSNQAVAQLVGEIANQIESAGEKSDAAVAAATAVWEKVCGGTLDLGTLALFRADAQAVLDRRESAPPPLESIVAGVTDRTDTGYALGVHLEGIRGLWHRLWALIALSKLSGGAGEHDEGVLAMRAQFESGLGRPLLPAEWDALAAHAARRAASMASRHSAS